MKIDSLRWTFEHSRMSDAERQRVATELNQSIVSLQMALDEAIRANATVEAEAAIRAEPPTRVAMAAPMGFRTQGWLGVTFEGPSDGPSGPQRLVRFYQYPKIALVEPGSPADRGGVLSGDTLLAFNGTDILDRDISFARLLVPDARVVMRVRREGNSKDLRVVVGEAPEYYVGRAAPPVPLARSGTRAPMIVEIPGGYRIQTRPQETPLPSRGGFGGTVWMGNGIGGAELRTITEGLGRALGAKSGVLVLTADPGSPAHESGLREGDVILKVAGREVATVRDLRMRLLESEGEGGVKLVILRDRKEREVTLRW